MSTDEGNVQQIKKQKKPVSLKATAHLQVTTFEDGNAQVSGPFQNPMQYYGLLGIAMESMINRHRAQQEKAEAQAQVKGSLSWWKRIVKRFSQQQI